MDGFFVKSTYLPAGMTAPVLKIEGLDKRFGAIQAVSDLSLEIPKGTVYGLLGPNGSGKTTTLGMVLGVIHASKGRYSWFGQDPSHEIRKRIGAILESPLFYPYLTGQQNLRLVAEIKGVSPDRIDGVLERVGLTERRHSRFSTYSLGMKQRLAIAAALLGDPEALVLDEPTNGLDPQGIHEMRQLIRDIAAEGVTIVLASHLLDEVEKVCSHVAVLRKGALLYSGEVDGLVSGASRMVLGAADLKGLRAALLNETGLEIVSEEGGRIFLDVTGVIDPAELNHRLMQAGITLSHLSLQKFSLEEQFLKLLSAT